MSAELLSLLLTVLVGGLVYFVIRGEWRVPRLRRPRPGEGEAVDEPVAKVREGVFKPDIPKGILEEKRVVNAMVIDELLEGLLPEGESPEPREPADFSDTYEAIRAAVPPITFPFTPDVVDSLAFTVRQSIKEGLSEDDRKEARREWSFMVLGGVLGAFVQVGLERLLELLGAG